MTQDHALNILKTGKNVFITGPAGSGKTYVINKYIKYLKDHEVSIGITASTGIAATHMGGITIHSWSGIGIKDKLSDHDLSEITERSNVRKKIEDTKVLFIDEVSMLHHFRLDLVDKVLKHIKKNELPFGGIQVVLCGDFFQLPPIARYGEPEALFIYNSEAWKKADFSVCYLSENYRQINDVSLTILNEIRSGKVSETSRDLLKSRYKKQNTTESSEYEIVIDRDRIDSLVEPTRLYTHNIDVDKINQTQLARVNNVEISYEMSVKGKKHLIENLKKSCLAPENLKIKKGARVMCVKNNFEKGYVNGTLGVVISCGYNVDPVIRTACSPDYPDGRLVTIEKADWSIDDEGKVIAEINQYPLRLAWAITVHKSQGMSLDAIEVDLSKSFEPGMGYVALSRVRTLAGLSILGINENALKVHPDVLSYDTVLRQLSNKAESILNYTDEKVIVSAQQRFIANVAPLYRMENGILKKSKKSKAVKLNTFEKTGILVREKMSLKEISKNRGMVIETIISHLEKLMELAPESGGLELSDISYLKKEISPIHFMKIERALEEVKDKQDDDKPPLLSPVKNKVGSNISFRDIQLVRVLLGYIKTK